MNDTERTMLEKHLQWLIDDVLPGFERSEQPTSWKAESIRRAKIQVANIEWRLATGNKAPICGYVGLYSEHDQGKCHHCSGKGNNPYGKRGKSSSLLATGEITSNR